MISTGTRARWLIVALLCVPFLCASSTGSAQTADDPWQKMNRGIFAFNEGLDAWAIEPAARVWNFVVPSRLQQGIKNVFDNVWLPAVFANHLLQGRPRDAFMEDLPRLIVNSAYGVGGLFDIASGMGIEDNYTDFGITMGRWGLPPGPYFVIPLLGPSSVRDGAGRVADMFSTPYGYFGPWWTFFIIRPIDLMNLRSIYMEEIAQSRADAFDFYLFVRDAWIQNRQHRVREARGELMQAPEQDDLYYFEDGFEDRFEDDSEEAEADHAVGSPDD